MKPAHMIRYAALFTALSIIMPVYVAWAGEHLSLENYLLGYTYASRKEMKASSEQLIDWIEDGKAVLVDIRFAEEQQAWGAGFGLRIPLSELPRRLGELPRDKIIVTACPHKDRATIAMVFLRTRGFDARYLADGLIGLAENLRGDDALYFIKMVNEKK
ncbi:MAG: rhodanese-like domain-containing protein [Pseudomonadota bacterium]